MRAPVMFGAEVVRIENVPKYAAKPLGNPNDHVPRLTAAATIAAAFA
jgi:hypothetical protein